MITNDKFTEDHQKAILTHEAALDAYKEEQLKLLSLEDNATNKYYKRVELEQLINIQKMQFRIDAKDFVLLNSSRFNLKEKEILIQESEKGNFLLFVIVIADPHRPVTRAINSVGCPLILLGTPPKKPQENTYYLIKGKTWQLLFAEEVKGTIVLREINIKLYACLEQSLKKLPKKSLKKYTENDLAEFRKGVSMIAKKTYQDISGISRYPQCLLPHQVTELRSYAPKKLSLIASESGFYASIDDCWVSSVEADIFLGKLIKNQNTRQSVSAEETGAQGGSTSKKDPHLLNLVRSEVQAGRGYTKFYKMIKEYDDYEPYEGTADCSTLYLDGKRLCYTTYSDKKMTSTHIAITTLKKYFTDVNKETLNTTTNPSITK